MGKKGFSVRLVAPLIGSTISNYIKITKGNNIEPRYYLKYILTFLIIIILTPFRWFDRLKYHRKLRTTTIEKPIFILGHWRSGTTFLHNLLCEDPNSGFVSTYQTVFPNNMATKWLFGPFMKIIMPGKRPSDNVELAVDFPQEEELGFMNMNPHSLYNFFYFPAHFQRYFEQAISNRGLLFEEQKRIEIDYLMLIRKAQLVANKNQLVIKNPVNTARINFLHKLFPDARYIHLIRNPYTVFLSSKKFFLNLLPTLWFEKVDDDVIEDMVIDLYNGLFTSYFEHKHLALNLVEIKFEDFELNPISELAGLYQKLAINGFDNAKPFFEKYLASQNDYKKNTYSIKQEEVDKIDKNWGVYIEKWGYKLPQNMKIV